MNGFRAPGGGAMSADEMAERLREAAATLSTVDRGLAAFVPASGAFGADSAGLPARIGRELHAHWEAALGARAREVADTADRLTGMAESVRAAAGDYDLTDVTAAHRIERDLL